MADEHNFCSCFQEALLVKEKTYPCGKGSICPECKQRYLIGSLALEHGCLEQGAEWIFIKIVDQFPEIRIDLDRYIQEHRPYFSRKANEEHYHYFS